jgi:hypothetical protein
MSPRSPFRAAWIAGALALGAAAPVFSQPCPPLCLVECLKPIAFADRWDDVTPIAGYTGGAKKVPNWQHNGRWDSEAFKDSNGNGMYDPGESFTDGNANGTYDAEPYNSLLTGYIPAPYPGNVLAPNGDLGLEITLLPSNSASLAPGAYVPIDFAPGGGGPSYTDNWATCNPASLGAGGTAQIQSANQVGPTNQAMRNLIALDPDAYWDDVTSSVAGSLFAQSPRIIMIPLLDPRVPATPGPASIVKVIAFFMEQMTGNAEVRGRLTTAVGSGQSCGTAGPAFIVNCPTPAATTSWGRVKGIYR